MTINVIFRIAAWICVNIDETAELSFSICSMEGVLSASSA
jgi:hypothetical protein